MTTNENLIHQILEACAQFEQKKISVLNLQSLIETHGSALEGVNQEVYAQLHDFSNDLERIQYACLLEEQYNQTLQMIQNLKHYILSIPQ